MRVIVSGGTGFIGREVVKKLRTDGHTVTVTTRNPDAARRTLGADIILEAPPKSADEAADLLRSQDAVLLLQGEPVVGRWTAKKKAALRISRVDATQIWVQGLALCADSARPRTLVSGSAVGYYGDTGDTRVDEASPAGSDFLSQLTLDWEESANQASTYGVRVVCLRTGLVLGHGGGALAKMLPAFRAGLGGPLGNGKQWMPWIHLEDQTRLILEALQNENYLGPINAVAPNPVRNETYTQILGDALNRPAFVRAPTFALRLAFGEGAQVLIAGQNAVPTRALELGFHFRFDTLERAFRDLLSSPASQAT